jgi:hypothetical protein
MSAAPAARIGTSDRLRHVTVSVRAEPLPEAVGAPSWRAWYRVPVRGLGTSVLALIAGCGRVGFDPVGSGAGADALGDGLDGSSTVPAGAQLWLEMDTDPNVVIIDRAGGHSVACTTSCPTVVSGIHGTAYNFANQQLQATYAADLDSTSGYTAAAWLRLDSLGGIACAFTKPSSNDVGDANSFGLCVLASGQINYDSDISVGNGDPLLGRTMPLAQWHHLAEVWDGTTKRGYFDGVLDVMKSTTIPGDSSNVMVGADNVVPKYQWPGAIDDAIYYTRALSAAEIAQLATP